jgi:hypothetical protein
MGTPDLKKMWRAVYRQAATQAEDQTRGLINEHVYNYPHSAGGGGAGGGLVELGRAVATAGQQDLRVPATGTLPTGYSGLYLIAAGLNNNATTTQNSDVYVFFNDDLATNAGGYSFTYITNQAGTVTVVVGGQWSSAGWNVGYAPAYNASDAMVNWGLSGTIPLHEGTTMPKTGQFVDGGRRGIAGEGPTTRTTTGIYTTAGAGGPNGAITSVTLRCGLLWRAGATFVVYGIKG